MSYMAAIDAPAEAIASAREKRNLRFMRVDLHSDRLGTIGAIIRNASRHGLGGRADAPLLLNEYVTVIVAGSDAVSGQVRWVRDSSFGLRLDSPIDPASLFAPRESEAAKLIRALPGNHVPDRFSPPKNCWRPGVRP